MVMVIWSLSLLKKKKHSKRNNQVCSAAVAWKQIEPHFLVSLEAIRKGERIFDLEEICNYKSI